MSFRSLIPSRSPLGRAVSLVSCALFSFAPLSGALVACGGDSGGGTSGDGDGDGDGDVGSGGTSTGGSGSGGTSTGGLGSGGGAGASPGTGGTGAGGSDPMGSMIPQLLLDAEEGCSTLDMDVHVDFTEDSFEAVIDGRVVDGSLEMDGADEVLMQESIAGDQVHLRWAGGVADGAQVAVTGWIEQSRQAEDSRYRCLDGQVIVRKDYFGALYYIFASETLYEANADGTCGAKMAGEIAYGCLPDDY